MATTGARRASASQANAGPKAGQSGSAGGGPKGVRARLITDFVTALVEDFARNGKAAIRKARERSPVQYLRLIATLVPSSWFGEEPEPEPIPVFAVAPRHEMVRSPHRLR